MQTADTSPHPIAATVKWAVSIIVLLILSASCAGGPERLQNDELERLQKDELKEHLERWRAHGIADYRMRYESDNIYRRSNRAIIVDVRNGLVHSAVYEDDGTPVSVDAVHSIDSLLIGLKEGFRRGYPDYAEVYVLYDARYGYPREVAYFSKSVSDIDSGTRTRVELLMTPEETARRISDEMVSIPAGTFRMGASSGDGNYNEKPVHRVAVPAFKMGKCEVTVTQWDACVADGECGGYSPNIWGWGWRRGDRPVENVSWDDAQSFIDWLNRKTGGNYRLPSEAEWEYAARAGGATEYSWGGYSGWDFGGPYCGDRWDCIAPECNAWGLHDMHGNAYEWVQDCWNDSYEGAPTDGSARISGDCGWRVVRGGAWDVTPDRNPWIPYIAIAYRTWYARTDRDDSTGFRLAQDQ